MEFGIWSLPFDSTILSLSARDISLCRHRDMYDASFLRICSAGGSCLFCDIDAVTVSMRAQRVV